MDDLLSLQRPRRPPFMDASARRGLETAARHLNLGPIPGEILDARLRSQLESRRRELNEQMRCGSAAEIAEVRATFIEMTGRAPGSHAEARYILKLAIEDLADVPLWALWEAARAFRRGDIGDGKFRPKPGQLRIEARRRAKAFDDELALLEKVLGAPIAEAVAPLELEKRKAMTARLKTLLAGEVS